MNQPTTKRETEQQISELSAKASAWEQRAEECSGPAFAGFMAAGYRADAEWARAEAARLRALLPTLPE
jgi:hypothetical protein